MLFCSIDQLNSCRPMESICSSCNRSFLTIGALQQHKRDSQAHTQSLSCGNCNRSFNSEHALEQHLRDSLVHHLVPETPLDAFFRSFSTFEYDPSQPPATSYARLRAHEGWQRGEAASADAWDRYQGALEGELRMWYGDEDDLAAWHALCHAISVEPPPRTCDRCEQV
ncbi:hypothetical protein HBI81_026760 [Parastagonospora nodorum]|nr:hypothetical protein HBI10_086850 [Parastagonospora nodorum]KAH4027213.1 hypothetical protein HBI13_055860 [Parastagonospora nodorum]KAH4914698.1 hypothetical protein HBH74_149580 [Parastagonospora nodorum]KAH4974319.1 hypothetical protein HBH73_048280 [Parastagonospora nodorum]KAH5086423.1 hypothetical protein HBH95_004920 [Parastagonospora nodorum]